MNRCTAPAGCTCSPLLAMPALPAFPQAIPVQATGSPMALPRPGSDLNTTLTRQPSANVSVRLDHWPVLSSLQQPLFEPCPHPPWQTFPLRTFRAYPLFSCTPSLPSHTSPAHRPAHPFCISHAHFVLRIPGTHTLLHPLFASNALLTCCICRRAAPTAAPSQLAPWWPGGRPWSP